MNLGRYCEIKGINEISDLEVGMDFRHPKFRREVFLRFYEFQLKYRGHSGAIYYTLEGLIEKLNMTREQQYWFTFLQGCSQNVITSFLIYNNFPSFEDLDIKKLDDWYKSVYLKIGWDTDRRFTKNKLIKCVESYKQNLGQFNQETFFERYLCKSQDKNLNFNRLWDKVTNNFYTFGRVAGFSYLRLLSVLGVNFEPNTLFMSEVEGSKSHRNGLCKVLGRDDLDWTRDNKLFNGYSKETLVWLEKEGQILLQEARDRIKHPQIGFLTLESALCSFKGFFRKNRRYPGVYNDILHDRIRLAEKTWGNEYDFSVFWEIRKNAIPSYLRVEDNPGDPSYCPQKQNYFRETGKIINMDKDWSCFQNDFYANKLI